MKQPADVKRLLSVLEYSVEVGKVDAAKSPRMLEAVFHNLEFRVTQLRDALAVVRS